MIKALLIVLLPLTSSGDYTTEMPSMQACLDARNVIIQQDPSIKTLCVPKNDETAKIKEFFAIFIDMIDQLQIENQLREKTAYDQQILNEELQQDCPTCKTE